MTKWMLLVAAGVQHNGRCRRRGSPIGQKTGTGGCTGRVRVSNISGWVHVHHDLGPS